MRRMIPVLISLVWMGACGEEPEQEVVPQGPTRADSVALAEAAFDATVFDTISWDGDQTAVERGGVVFSYSCRKCHGDGGRGNGNFVFQGDTLRPPSFLATDWQYAEDGIGLRERIFSGNAAGMPYWGLAGLKYQDVDAVADYIVEFLRPNYGEAM